MDKGKITKEKHRLEAILDKAEVPQNQREVLSSVIDNMAWQKVKLDEARLQMMKEDIVVQYDNGGGQTGTRENPIFKAYLNLWRAYMAGLEKFTSYLPKEMQEEIKTGTIDMLSYVREMKKAK